MHNDINEWTLQAHTENFNDVKWTSKNDMSLVTSANWFYVSRDNFMMCLHNVLVISDINSFFTWKTYCEQTISSLESFYHHLKRSRRKAFCSFTWVSLITRREIVIYVVCMFLSFYYLCFSSPFVSCLGNKKKQGWRGRQAIKCNWGKLMFAFEPRKENFQR